MSTEKNLQLRTWSKAYASWKAEHKPLWKENGPGFGAGIEGMGSGSDLALEYYATREDSPIFVYVMGGTEVRKVGLPGYKPRTRKGVLTTRPGANFTMVPNKRYSGIEARDWHETIAQRRTKPFTSKIQKAMSTGAARFSKTGRIVIRVTI